MSTLDSFLARVSRRRRVAGLSRALAIGLVPTALTTLLADAVCVATGHVGADLRYAVPFAVCSVALAVLATPRPAADRVAADADDRLGTRDLLATARRIDPASADPFERAVRSRADAACAPLGPDDVRRAAGPSSVGRLWAVTAVAVLLCLAAGFAVREFRPTPAFALAGSSAKPSEGDDTLRMTKEDPSSLLPARPGAGRSTAGEGSALPAPPEPAGRSLATPRAPDQTRPSDPTPVDSPSADDDSREGIGPGAATGAKGATGGDDLPLVPLSRERSERFPAREPSATHDRNASIVPPPGISGRATNRSTEPDDGPDPLGTVDARPAPAVEPWDSEDWPAAREAAGAAIRAGWGDRADRDLARAYFDR